MTRNSSVHKKTVAISPHLDDVALSAFVASAEGRIGKVVTVFTESSGMDVPHSEWHAITSVSNPKIRHHERRQSDVDFWDSLGIDIAHLGFRECEAPPARELKRKLIAHCAGYGTVLCPAAIGGHSEHILVRNALFDLRNELGDLEFYGELPYSAFFGWPTDPSESNVDVKGYWNFHLAPVNKGPQPMEADLRKLSDHLLNSKVNRLRAYFTEFGAVTGGSLRLAETTELFRYEVTFVKRQRP